MAAGHSRAAPRVLGLTGPIACGKTTVGDILLEMGAIERIDADEVVHELMAARSDTTRTIADTFGAGLIAADGSIDRGALGTVVFGDETKLRTLESIVHPEVGRVIRRRVEARAGQEGVVVVDAVKLLQSDLAEMCDAIWVVLCRPDVEMRRLTGKRGMTAEMARDRIAAQPTFDDARISAVIENSESPADLRRQVQELWESSSLAAE
ncbi:MAG TPA: dephospho-CoA kinase [Chloroflexota bacterium]